MNSFIQQQSRYRFFMAVLLLAIITTLFWTSSRYPSLGDKALLGGSIQLEDPLSFEALLPVEATFPLWKKIGYSTINWLDTNRQGMVFGILMGAVFLTLLRYVQRISFKGAQMNAALGLLIGAPMGVCVNCAAPIAKGLYSGGARAETTLAAMIASPTMNIVILTMLFSILPVYMAVTKIGLSLFVILLAVPLICRLLPSRELQIPLNERRTCPLPARAIASNPELFVPAAKGFLGDFATDFWYIIKMTVPLMVLAGFLGAVVATLVPVEALTSLKFGVLGLIAVALIGTFLPVPIAFDVVICGALLAAGMPVGYVMTLLFTLGIFSIYSFFIVSGSISLRAALLVAATVALLGMLAGAGVHQWHQSQTQKALRLLTAQTPPIAPVINDLNVAGDDQSPVQNSDQSRQTLSAKSERTSTLTITATQHHERSPASTLPFSSIEAHSIGIDQPIEFSFKDMWPPFWEGRSIAAGDIDQDNDIDIVIASTRVGFHTYLNDGTGTFARQTHDLDAIEHWRIFNAVLVDMNNDHWPDLFLATYKNGNHILWNKNGRFDARNSSPVSNRDDAILSMALSFADVNQDGFTDVALGNWAAGWYRRVPGEESRNRVIFNDEGKLTGTQYMDLPGIPGETLSILLSDLNQDGHADLLVGNDFEVPDVYYYGDGTGNFNQVLKSQNIIPFTTTTTMAIKNHDLNNDLIPEIYLAQIAGRASGISDRLNMRDIDKYCDDIVRLTDKETCLKNMAIKNWYKAGNNFDPSYASKCLDLDETYASECKAMLVKDLAIQSEDPSLCELIHQDQTEAKAYCQIHFKPAYVASSQEQENSYPQIKQRNILLVRQNGQSYKDQSIESGLEVGGWSWDTKIADFDNDEWSDIFIVNGTWVPNEVTPSNMYYSNNGNGNGNDAEKFTELAREFGLEDYFITAAAVNVDIDRDGDLDIITVPVNAPIKAFINNNQNGNAISFSLRDEIGNSAGIGARIIIRYGENGNKTQLREIQLGGGFQSFDAPEVHFGLGESTTISSATIHWADQTTDDITGPLKANTHYKIMRLPQ